MKKLILSVIFLLSTISLFAVPFTEDSITSCLNKFLYGKGMYIILMDEEGTIYIPRNAILFYTQKGDELSLSISSLHEIKISSKECKDISIDSNGNLVLLGI